MELHTFSSLKKEFLPQYQDSMTLADRAIVYFNPHTLAHKKLEPITSAMIKEGFGQNNIEIFTDSDVLFDQLKEIQWEGKNLLLMSSGTFSGKDLPLLAKTLLSQT